MHRVQSWKNLFAVWLLMFLPALSFTATVNDEFIQDLRSDYETIAGFLNKKLGENIGFYTTSGRVTAPSVLKFTTGPRFQVGILVGADLWKIGDLNTQLTLQAVQGAAQVDIPSTLPFPYPVWYGRAALLKGLDVGIRGTGFPRLELNNTDFSASVANKGFGADVRYRMLDDPRYPTVAFGFSLDWMEGDFYFRNTVTDQGTWQDSGGTTYNYTVTGNSTHRSAWDVRAMGFHLTAGKKFVLLYSFGGVSFYRYAGDASASLAMEVTETVESGGVPVPGTGQTLSEIFGETRRVDPIGVKYHGGFEIGTGFIWSVIAETDGTTHAFGTGFRLQL